MNRDSPFSAELEEAVFKPRRELVDQPRDEAVKLAQSPPAATKLPWSKYVPFPTGTALDVKVGALGLAISGTGKVEERTDDKLAFSFVVPVKLDIPPFFKVDNESSARVAITYIGEGGRNLVAFSLNHAREREERISIQSTPNERILTAPGGLKVKTNAPSPAPDTITLKVLRIRPKQDGVELEAEMADLPNALIQASRTPAAARK